eukprot:TRINITY_DN1261_c0_g1_i1.p1 TRINITY_DN1261_c0_g1~~TRINITY_DN1261_c0_g1_i1.p1  ORF type:complete len:124 (+),score=21.77 TRINITY_DN1261_c0_g1_i1:243-614(+)
MFSGFGRIVQHCFLDDYPASPCTDVYWLKFENVATSRKAKKSCDDVLFIGSLLHVTYAPEFESETDTEMKLEERRREIIRFRQNSFSQRNQLSPQESSVNSTILEIREKLRSGAKRKKKKRNG